MEHPQLADVFLYGKECEKGYARFPRVCLSEAISSLHTVSVLPGFSSVQLPMMIQWKRVRAFCDVFPV